VTDLASALAAVPADIVTALAREYGALQSRFARQDWAPASLNGGRFAEALVRYLEWKQSGHYTAIGAQLPRERILNAVRSDPTMDPGLRLHVLKCAELLLDVRNRRDVAHLGHDVDVNEMDTHLVLRLAAWSLGEIIRQEGSVPPGDRQTLLDRLSSRAVPLVEEIGGELVVLSTSLDASDRALVALYHAHPDAISIVDLQKAVGYGNLSRFRSSVLGALARRRRVYIAADGVHITRLGVAHVESQISLQIDLVT
jgi:hypothetical protein